MLFHVTATHTTADCPLYNEALRPALQEADASSEALAQELGLTVHFAVTGAPAHVFYSLLEADDYSAVQRYLAAIPMKQEFTIVPVVSLRQATTSLLEPTSAE
jgi:muconolactone delta-isomerase